MTLIGDSIIQEEFSYYIKDFLSSLGISIGPWGSVYFILSNLQTFADAQGRLSVTNADNFAETINVSAFGGAETSSVLIGWKEHPTATLPNTATNINVKYF